MRSSQKRDFANTILLKYGRCRFSRSAASGNIAVTNVITASCVVMCRFDLPEYQYCDKGLARETLLAEISNALAPERPCGQTATC